MTNRVSQIISDESLNRGIQIESAGKPNAKAKTSSATGLAQFIDSSWLGILYKHGTLNIAKRIKYNPKANPLFTVPDGGEREILDLRKAEGNPTLLKLNIDMMARLWEDNAKAIGPGFTDGDLYLAHFAGVGTAARLHKADQSGSAAAIFGKAATKANAGIIVGKTVGQVRAWAAREMQTRWDKSGRHDWIGLYYPMDMFPVPVPRPKPEPEEDHHAPIKLEPTTEDDEESEETSEASDADDAKDVSAPAVDSPASSVGDVAEASQESTTLPAGVKIQGDTDTWWIQFRLQRMHYGPSVLDGRYGGKTSAAIAAFLNDRPDKQYLKPPTSMTEYLAMREALKIELDHAEAEHWKRPVTQARKEASPEIVKQAAPEAAPIQRNVSFGWLGAIGTAITAFFQWAGDTIKDLWEFFTANKDSIPDVVTQQSTLSWLWEKVTSLPAYVWLLLACVSFLFFTFNSSSGLKTIIDKIKSGER